MDIITVSKQSLVISSEVAELTISDHYLVYVILNLKPPKQAPNYIVTRRFKNYKVDQFIDDISHIPWETLSLLESADEQLDAFNDLFVTCLKHHAPLKTIQLKRKPNPARDQL